MNNMIQAEVSTWLSFIERIEKEYSALAPTTKAQGIGGIRHQQIQLFLRNNVVRLGYGAEIEQQLATDSRQKVDVGIRGNGVRVACEIPISTKYNEYPNIRKCLDAGYDYVVSVALDRGTLGIVSNGCQGKLTEEEKARVKFLFPEELIEFLKELKSKPVVDTGDAKEVLGYKLRVTHVPVSPEEAKSKRSAIAEIMARSILRERQAQ